MAKGEPWGEKWKVVRELSSGGQGSTRVVEPASGGGAQAVLKALHRDRSSPHDRARMHREVAALESLAAAGVKVPKVFDGNTERHVDGGVRLYFVMEYIPGTTLTRAIEDGGKLALDKAAAFALALAATVSAAHKQSVLHRDLKPDNIMVRDAASDDLVIVDYGISFNKADEDGADLTRVGEHIGNPFLILPETRTPTGDKRDFRSDICAVCGVLYYCLTGRKPGMLRDSAGTPIHRSPGCSVREAVGDDPRLKQLELLLDCGLAHDVHARFQSWEELTGRLSAVLVAGGVPAEEESLAALANRISALVIKHNRPARAKMYLPKAAELWKEVATFTQNLKTAMPPQLDFVFTPSLKVPYHLPDEVGHFVGGAVTLTVGLTVTPRSFQCHALYAIHVTQVQFVLTRAFALKESPQSADPPPSVVNQDGSWKSLHWFDPEEWPSFSTLRPHFEGGIRMAMQSLAEVGLPPKAWPG